MPAASATLIWTMRKRLPPGWWVVRRTFTKRASTGGNVSVVVGSLNAPGSIEAEPSASFVKPSVTLADEAQTSTSFIPYIWGSVVMVTEPIRAVSRLKNEITISTGPGVAGVP